MMKFFLSLVFTLFALSSCVSEDTQVDPAQSKIHYDLALELAQYSLYQNALEEFDLAIKFDPGNINAYRKKGLVEFGLKQYEEAEKLFKKVISLDPENVQAYINLGMVKYTTGNKVDAKKLWEKSIDIKKDDNDSKAINNIANLYKKKKIMTRQLSIIDWPLITALKMQCI